MLSSACLCRALCALAYMSVSVCYAQPAVIDSLFDSAPARAMSAHRTFKLNTTASLNLATKADKLTLKSFPLADGSSAGFDLTPMQLYKPGFSMTMVNAGGSTHSVVMPEVQAWRGSELAGGERSIFLARRSDGTVSAMVTGSTESPDTVVMPEASGTDYTARPAELPDRDYCGVGDLTGNPDSEAVTAGAVASEPETAELGTGTRQVELMLDVSYPTYQKFGGDTARIADYLTQLMGSVVSIYRRDLDVQLVVSHVFIWSTPDPFNVDLDGNGTLSTGDQLNSYRDFVYKNRRSISRDLSHLINYNTGLGGIAYVGTLCNESYGLGVSNVYANMSFPVDFNTYYWDTMVVSHEIGHNFGSPHTHCYSPPIDCCATQASCSTCATATPAAGTIMSYCHLQMGRGGSMIMKFHERCVDLMRSKVDAAACLMPFVSTPKLGVASTSSVPILSGDMTPSVTDTTDFSAVEAGSNVVNRTFLIGNQGGVELLINGAITVTGSSLFSISAQPPDTSLSPGEASGFILTFNPAFEGLHEGVVTIPSNDPTVPQFRFAVKATAVRRASSQLFLYRGNTLIPDGNAAGVTINIPVAGVGSVIDVDFLIDGTNCGDPAAVGLQHNYVGDLKMVLLSPAGTRVTLMDRPGIGNFGSSGSNFCGTVLDDQGGGPGINNITSSGTDGLPPPYSATFTPLEPLAAFNGENADGVWKLQVSDNQSPDSGYIREASVRITGSQAPSSTVADWSAY